MTDNPWTRLNSREVYKSPWIRVREDEVITPAGTPGIYGVVEARPAVGILAFTEDDHIYLVGQYRYPLDLYSWEIIEGGSEVGESFLEAAKRELREEAGVEAAEWEQLPGEIFLANCNSDQAAYFFIARGLRQVGAEPDETEQLAIRTVSFAEALQMVLSGEITDAMSMLGILKYHAIRSRL